ncbi:hypothetical protein FACS189432_01160 [Bacteroidia bacterium]|nr:hypothetical protein FACS189426_03420 [Bacteroidia bacterium]GHT26540.1 hypothetical protein FACS189432_01160 [Bacteroidia bacterium]GHV71084.1 hypothetical protein FACS189420_4820 [Bacteroidia bacterium]
MKISKLTPNLAVADIRKTVDFYNGKLGFELVMAVPETQDSIDEQFVNEKEYVYAMMKKDGAELMFQREDSFREDVILANKTAIGASASFFMQGKGIECFYNDLKNKDVELSEIKLTWYGIKEFYLKDNNGYILGFAEETE